jgi:hypothetical protein
MSIIGTGTSQFSGLYFWLTNNQVALTRPGHTARYQKDAIAYGNLSTIQIGGVDTDPVQVDALIAATDYATLEALRGTVGTLTLLGDVARSALLAAITQPKFYAEGFAIVQLKFEFA